MAGTVDIAKLVFSFIICFFGYLFLCVALLVCIYIFFRAVICPMILCGRCELVGMGWLNGVESAAAASSQNSSSQAAPTQQISVLPVVDGKDVMIPPVAQAKEIGERQRWTGGGVDVQSDSSVFSAPQEIKENNKNERRASLRGDGGSTGARPNPDYYKKPSETGDPSLLSPFMQTQLSEVIQPAHGRPYANPPSNDGSPLLRPRAQAIPLETLLSKEVLHPYGFQHNATYEDQTSRSPTSDPALDSASQSSAKSVTTLQTYVQSPSGNRNPPFHPLEQYPTTDANTHSDIWEPTRQNVEVIHRTSTPHSAQPNDHLHSRIERPLTHEFGQNPTSDVQTQTSPEVVESIIDQAHPLPNNGSLTSQPNARDPLQDTQNTQSKHK